MDETLSVLHSVLLSGNFTSNRTARLPSQTAILNVIRNGKRALKKDPVLLEITGHFVIVGDMHGNFDDLLRIFERFGYPPEQKYLFLGDYVDRGEYGIEVLLVLLSLKHLFPECVYMLRGNHESTSMSTYYGFKDECTSRLSEKCYEKFTSMFNALPLAAVVNNRAFCVHGGISQHATLISSIKELKKPYNLPSYGAVSDMLWSDPFVRICGFRASERGVGYRFGGLPTRQFLKQNGLEVLIRSHESCRKGFAWPFQSDPLCANLCLTVFSTSDYCGEGNSAAVVRLQTEGALVIEELKPLTAEERAAMRIVLPKWLLDAKSVREPPMDEIPCSEPNVIIP